MQPNLIRQYKYRMKRFILLFFVALSVSAFADYYVAGNGSAGNPWCDGKSWNPSGSKMTDGSITFAGVPVGSYSFKVTTGSWTTNYGYSALNKDCSNLYATTDGDGNVCFTLQAAQDVTIAFANSKICLTGTIGNEYPDMSQYNLVGVPAECEDVMLQVFYWDSHNKTTYGGKTTRWMNLLNDTVALSNDFDLIWFPPSTGGDGVGYYPKSYSFKSTSAWGSKADLIKLIAALRRGNTKALADIVINHRQSNNGWAKGFSTDDFGGYGQFTLTSEHICSTDEAKTNSSSDSKSLTYGNPDTGNNDGGCRDLDHTNPYVQEMCKAYTRFMLDSIGFAGFRYDMVIGYLGKYLSDYNLASQPYISVGEYWSDLTSTKNYLESAQYNTMVFDFPQKYAIKSAMNNGSYAGLKSVSNSLRGQGLSKYAVTFVDNHDTYGRDNSDYLVKDIKAAGAAKKVLQANAFILMMPGLPCVFYPHWKTYQTEISYMISLRKAAGIHSESTVTDEVAGSQNYSATIQGHNGSIILRMGTSRETTVPAGYVLKMTGCDMDIYLSADCAGDDTMQTFSSLEDVLSAPEATKEIRNGQVYIIRNGIRYDALGRVVNEK